MYHSVEGSVGGNNSGTRRGGGVAIVCKCVVAVHRIKMYTVSYRYSLDYALHCL